MKLMISKTIAKIFNQSSNARKIFNTVEMKPMNSFEEILRMSSSLTFKYKTNIENLKLKPSNSAIELFCSWIDLKLLLIEGRKTRSC